MKLGRNEEAETILKNLLDSANRSMGRGSGEGPGAFGERQSPRARLASAHYLAGLAHLGLGETAMAKNEFTATLEATPDSLGAKVELARLP